MIATCGTCGAYGAACGCRPGPGTWLALGAVGVLAAASLLGRGSADRREVPSSRWSVRVMDTLMPWQETASLQGTPDRAEAQRQYARLAREYEARGPRSRYRVDLVGGVPGGLRRTVRSTAHIEAL